MEFWVIFISFARCELLRRQIMPNLQNIRFVTANYSYLQGLKFLPLGVAMFGVALWANGLRGPARDLRLLVPLGLVIGLALTIVLIARYYAQTFGHVKRTPQSVRVERVLSALGVPLALVAGWFDFILRTPIS